MTESSGMRDERIEIRNGEVTISVRVVGSGPLVIMLHGFPDLGLGFDRQARPLAEAGYTVAIPDMRGYGASSKPEDVDAYSWDKSAADVFAIADALGAEKFVVVGHDMGSGVAWRCALLAPDRVVGVVSLSAPYFVAEGGERGEATRSGLNELDPENFFYIRWMQQPDKPEAELERDSRASIKQIFWLISGDAPSDEWLKTRPATNTMLQGLLPPPDGPLSFMDDATLDRYGDAFAQGGFFGPCSWYRNLDQNARDAAARGSQIIRQPAAYISGEFETALQMLPDILDRQREFVPNLAFEAVLPGVGHWVHQEAPEETNKLILRFLDEAKPFGRNA